MRKKVRKIKLYLDTSVISALFDEGSPEIMYWTHEFWKFIDEFDVFISDVVLTEIGKTFDTRLRRKTKEIVRMVNAIYNYPILEITSPPETLGGKNNEKISKKRLKELEMEVKKEFPKSYGLKQVHLARLIIEEKTRNLSQKELIEFYREQAKAVRGKKEFTARKV